MKKKLKLPIAYHENQTKIFFEDVGIRTKMIAKGRRFGLTMGFANYAIESMLDGVSPVLWIDTINANIDRYVERYFLPVLNKLPSNLWTWKQVKKELTIGNSVLDFRSADSPESIEGFGYALIILNEAGIILKDESLWYNTVLPMTLDHQATILCGGTPKGGGGLFKNLCKKSEKRPDQRFYHFTSYDNPFLQKAEIDALCEDMPDLVKRQEIFGEFIDDTSMVFPNFKNCIRGELQKPILMESYYAGLDLGRIRDRTILIICNSQNHVVYFKRVQTSWQYQKRLVSDVLKRYNNASCYVDSTGLGDPIASDLSDAGCNIRPYIFTALSKSQLIESLMLNIEKEEISFPELPELIEELESFEYQTTATGVKYSAPSGMHDDAVIALALANLWHKKKIDWSIINNESLIGQDLESYEALTRPDFWYA